MGLKVGDNAPEVILKNQYNEEVSLNSFNGKWIVLYFYPKDNTPGCTTEAVGFSSNLAKIKSLNAEVIGISADTCESHSRFIKLKNLEIILLSDPERLIIEKYDCWKLKKMYGKEYMGIQRTTYLIDPEGKIAYIWDKVKVNNHAEEVIMKIEEIKK